ncbi:hypothetical protein CS063_07610 [Sporanaerobium hydrogeniformans]|uniref:Uncharacterized protein n=1 Tax=Sporanaerobium hydrogeniformans TaxID=3072179 RepID=A0AC61DE16_9FIRM|nr:hypothetical protein [Sporanaerobium hydrogeniformans]PHV70882.1 hypothetical protein CS063_07610 [Sporanaerobium hydrogeniformans]
MSEQVFESREELMKQIEGQMEQAKLAFENLKALGNELAILSQAEVKGEYQVAEEEEENEGEEYGKGGGGGHHKPSCCPCMCCCQNPCSQYPCKCRKCDYLQVRAIGKWELGFQALEQAWNTLGLAGDQFDDGYQALGEAIGLFIAAHRCADKHDCQDYCKKHHCGCY